MFDLSHDDGKRERASEGERERERARERERVGEVAERISISRPPSLRLRR